MSPPIGLSHSWILPCAVGVGAAVVLGAFLIVWFYREDIVRGVHRDGWFSAIPWVLMSLIGMTLVWTFAYLVVLFIPVLAGGALLARGGFWVISRGIRPHRDLREDPWHKRRML